MCAYISARGVGHPVWDSALGPGFGVGFGFGSSFGFGFGFGFSFGFAIGFTTFSFLFAFGFFFLPGGITPSARTERVESIATGLFQDDRNKDPLFRILAVAFATRYLDDLYRFYRHDLFLLINFPPLWLTYSFLLLVDLPE